MEKEIQQHKHFQSQSGERVTADTPPELQVVLSYVPTVAADLLYWRLLSGHILIAKLNPHNVVKGKWMVLLLHKEWFPIT